MRKILHQIFKPENLFGCFRIKKIFSFTYRTFTVFHFWREKYGYDQYGSLGVMPEYLHLQKLLEESNDESDKSEV